MEKVNVIDGVGHITLRGTEDKALIIKGRNISSVSALSEKNDPNIRTLIVAEYGKGESAVYFSVQETPEEVLALMKQASDAAKDAEAPTPAATEETQAAVE